MRGGVRLLRRRRGWSGRGGGRGLHGRRAPPVPARRAGNARASRPREAGAPCPTTSQARSRWRSGSRARISRCVVQVRAANTGTVDVTVECDAAGYRPSRVTRRASAGATSARVDRDSVGPARRSGLPGRSGRSGRSGCVPVVGGCRGRGGRARRRGPGSGVHRRRDARGPAGHLARSTARTARRRGRGGGAAPGLIDDLPQHPVDGRLAGSLTLHVEPVAAALASRCGRSTGRT